MPAPPRLRSSDASKAPALAPPPGEFPSRFGAAARRAKLPRMHTASNVAAGAVAALHVWFLVLEMFLWATPFGARTFGRPLPEMQQSRTLAANQGLYNGFLAAGLVWSLITGAAEVRIFFLACVLIAGLYGAATVSRKILFLQALPAAAGLIATLLA